MAAWIIGGVLVWIIGGVFVVTAWLSPPIMRWLRQRTIVTRNLIVIGVLWVVYFVTAIIVMRDTILSLKFFTALSMGAFWLSVFFFFQFIVHLCKLISDEQKGFRRSTAREIISAARSGSPIQEVSWKEDILQAVFWFFIFWYCMYVVFSYS
jgi:hypothetical protein